MTESEAESAAVEIAKPRRSKPLSRDEIASICDLDRECNGDSAFCFLWWRGAVAESGSKPPRRQAAMNFVWKAVGEQRRFLAAAAWEYNGVRDGRRQWRLRTVFTHPDYRREGFAAQLVSGTPLDTKDYEVVADVAERDLATQKFFSGCGWHGLPLTKLDGNGVIRFRAAFSGCPEIAGGDGEAKPKRRRRKRRPPPPQPLGAAK